MEISDATTTTPATDAPRIDIAQLNLLNGSDDAAGGSCCGGGCCS